MVDKSIQFNNDGISPLKVPGYGLPVQQEAGDEYFRHAIRDYYGARFTAKELAMVTLMNAITDKPNWHAKVFDDSIVEKWRKEAKDSHEYHTDISLDWCFKELRDKATAFATCNFVQVLDAHGVVIKSDTLVSEELRQRLIKEAEPLQNNPQKDWHPRSGDKVLNLIHPSLYPLVYGESRILPSGLVNFENISESYGKGEIIPENSTLEVPQHDRDVYTIPEVDRWAGIYSQYYQWLPCEVKFVGESGSTVRISSYINNLHPQHHPGLYSVIEKFISLSIPMWNDLLFTNKNPINNKTRGHSDLRIEVNSAKYDHEEPLELSNLDPKDPNSKAKLDEYWSKEDNPEMRLEDDAEFPDRYEDGESRGLAFHMLVNWKWKRVRKVIHPEPERDYEAWTKTVVPSADLENKFRDQGLQIIVKMSGIELSPEKPKYDGGNWHLEGMSNEHIVATSIYYYDVDNVTESNISFRSEAFLDHMKLDYQQFDHGGLEALFGGKNFDGLYDTPSIQEVGTIKTQQRRMIAFPNTLQHKVEPFELLDKSKSGHRRFLVLWLVDPHYRIISTANVPPQQKHWWSNEIRHIGWNLPPELTEMVLDEASEWLMDENKVNEIRLKLMAERVDFGTTVEKNFGFYYLCEH